ncbi:hypothetical protein EVAR_19594_1 [Eumeta japonica]|uniref:Uncharacterized protein n=1 Tax=Eumeta variegata TaxID=151549 RepID=A0A4C1UF43_EUMVA|nr:hypothetical protein EVAR_19594_1 [Eumeta japonica]
MPAQLAHCFFQLSNLLINRQSECIIECQVKVFGVRNSLHSVWLVVIIATFISRKATRLIDRAPRVRRDCYGTGGGAGRYSDVIPRNAFASGVS